MENSNLLRHQKIKSLTAQQTEEVADAAIELWKQLATLIISIVGKGGFDSLYARSLFLTRPTFPWLGTSSASAPTDHRFEALKAGLEAQPPALIREANSLLLITFTDILASLVGEPLTVRILDSAWGHDVHNPTGEEFKDE